MSARVEGRIAMRFHGFDDASWAASLLRIALDEMGPDWFEAGQSIEVVGVDLVRVEESQDEQS